MQVRIVGHDLPGGRFGHQDQSGGPCYAQIHVGIQRKGDVEQLVSATADRAVFDLELRPKGDQDAVGPHAQGRPGERFVYLVWVHGSHREMFRRAKLMISDVPGDVWRAGVAGEPIEAVLRLTDSCGGPLCARVPPELVTWRVGASASGALGDGPDPAG